MPAPTDKPPRSSCRIRRFQAGNEPTLFRVYRSAIALIASRCYAPEQVRSWLPEEQEFPSRVQRVRSLAPFVALGEGLEGGRT